MAAREEKKTGDRFIATRWSLVALAADPQRPEHQQAMADLLRRYLPALKSHVIHRFHVAPDRADDLLQSFIAQRMLERELLAKADRSRGKFRTFLCTALDHFVSNELRYERAERRGGGHVSSLDDGRVLEPMDDSPAPGEGFDVQWARQVVDQAIELMRSECEKSHRSDVWEIFDCRVLRPALQDTAAPPYDQLVERFGLESPTQASNLLVTAKRMFARMLREVVAEYSADSKEVDGEIADLRSILSRADRGKD